MEHGPRLRIARVSPSPVIVGKMAALAFETPPGAKV